jgi:hypothetical protein
LAASVPVLAIVWWLASPLFLDDEVDEAFPAAATVAGVETATEAETAASVDATTRATSPAVQSDVSETDASGPIALAAGSFEGFDAVHQGSGAATIYDVDGGPVLRFEDFDVTNGPDLRVNLVLDDGSMLDLGALKGNVGNQNYDIPADVDLESVSSVLIYCRAFSVPFAEADFA